MEHANSTQCTAADVLPTVYKLESKLSADWRALRGAADKTASLWNQLTSDLNGLCSSDESIVFFGSIARGEATESSDADWAYLIDGQAHPDHFEAAQAIAEKIGKIIGKPPGREGVFGNLIFSHDLIQHIASGDDGGNRAGAAGVAACGSWITRAVAFRTYGTGARLGLDEQRRSSLFGACLTKS